MSAAGKAAATRSNVLRLRRRLEQVDKGAALLRKKREALVRELLTRARPAVDTRRSIEEEAHAAYLALLDALAAMGHDGLAPLAWPTRELLVDLRAHEVSGIRGVDLVRRPVLVRSIAARGIAAGPGDATAAAAAEAFERLLEALVAAAPEELFLRKLGEALRRATRLVNTLEQRVSRAIGGDLSAMRRTLEEREREEKLRLKRIVARRNRGK